MSRMLSMLCLLPRVTMPLMKEAWIEYTWAHAKEHGWEPFVFYRITNGVEVEFCKKPTALLHRGVWIYQGSVSELCPYGVGMTREEAEALSIQRWSFPRCGTCTSPLDLMSFPRCGTSFPRIGAGTRPDLYAAFEEEFYKEQYRGTSLRARL